jgi:hypothetical protein
MAGDQDRRRFPRRPLAENILGYLDGTRFDIQSSNISVGGMFLRTHPGEVFPMGTRLALVFNRLEGPERRVLLVAQVVRRQEEPEPGVGLAWEKAVTAGAPAELTQVLERVIGARAEVIERKLVRETNTNHWVYSFAEPSPVPEGNAPAGGPALVVDAGRVPPVKARATPATVLHPPPPPPAPPPSHAFPGPMTQQLEVERLRAPVSLRGKLSGKHATWPCTVRSLGLSAALVETEEPVAPPFERFALSIAFPVGSNQMELSATCRLESIEPARVAGVAALDLTFESIDEGPLEGFLRRYVRWAAQNSVQDA